ncbi:MAG: arabinan endo-1,5-alpha-L-arabinosidase [Pedobacter sp.]|nr:MAG: arabinan endo-1,5-alpha-L-arabinosidase [Pedobacter sp.]
MKNLLALFIFLCSSNAIAQDLAQNIKVHDPVIIKQDSTFYIFATGKGIAKWSSIDMINWTREKPVFENPPEWAIKDVLGFKDHIWAPDISFYNGKYYLFYSVSVFGKNNSAIGLTTNKTLNENDPNYKWIDQGKIIQSIPRETDWNAIDPNLIIDQKGNPYLAFGSFWGGLKLVKLTKDSLKVDGSLNDITTIANRRAANVKTGANAIEAPFIYQKDKYYYLFASIDYCCKAEKSTYKVIVGRADKVTGPYKDKEGKNLTEGGGSIVVSGNKNWYGVGHNAVAIFNKQDYLVFHGYDASDKGISKLLIRKFKWQNGWPTADLYEE